MVAEKQKYVVLKKFAEFETREYFPVVMADVVLGADRSSAANKAFGFLFKYISKNKISMTAPVLQEKMPDDKWRVSFVMPASSQMEDLPEPSETQVSLRHVGSERIAVLRFSGGSSESLVSRKEEKLRALMNTHGLLAQGAARVARFNPPWIPPFMRHNEINIVFSDSDVSS